MELTNLLKALNAVMKECKYVQKDKENAFHRYKYAGEESLLEVLRPALVKHGIVLLPSLDSVSAIDEHGNTHIVVAYTLAHVSGEVWPTPIKVPGCGNDRNKQGGVGDKGTYKALTGANKYLLFKLFQIATGDDPENETALDRGEIDLLKAGPVKSPPAPNWKKEEKAYQLTSPGGKITPCGYGSSFLTELEHRMTDEGEDPVAWWAINGSTAEMIAEKHPHAKGHVDRIRAKAMEEGK
jgi:hypothetical protein